MALEFFVTIFSNRGFSFINRFLRVGLPLPDVHPPVNSGKLILKAAGHTGHGRFKFISKMCNHATIKTRFRI